MAVSAHEASTNGKQFLPRTFSLVSNAQAGGLLGQQEGDDSLERALAAGGGEVHVIAADAGTLPERVALAKATGAECVVVAGGDGSIACAASALIGTELSLGLIPCGTMNLLAKDLGIDPADRAAAVNTLVEGKTRLIDAGRLGEHAFLCASMLGTPARLARHREAGRQRGNGLRAWTGFASAALRALRRNRSMRVVMRFDGGVIRRRSPSITVTVNRLNDDSARLFGRDDLSGGELAVYVVRRSSAARQLWLLLRTLLTGRLREPHVEVFTTKRLEVRSLEPAMHVLIDGELRLLPPPLRYSIVPDALRVVVPDET
jgi:diacylglycerol kinase family enzyme